jgi:hypothetical protein
MMSFSLFLLFYNVFEVFAFVISKPRSSLTRRRASIASDDDDRSIGHINMLLSNVTAQKYKSHMSHDVVLLCPLCHEVAQVAAQERRKELLKEAVVVRQKDLIASSAYIQTCIKFEAWRWPYRDGEINCHQQEWRNVNESFEPI